MTAPTLDPKALKAVAQAISAIDMEKLEANGIGATHLEEAEAAILAWMRTQELVGKEAVRLLRQVYDPPRSFSRRLWDHSVSKFLSALTEPFEEVNEKRDTDVSHPRAPVERWRSLAVRLDDFLNAGGSADAVAIAVDTLILHHLHVALTDPETEEET